MNGFNYFISTYNQVTHLLCILENFRISIDEFLDSQADQFYSQLCQFIGQCWLIYPQLNINSDSSKCKFRFSDCINNSISCEWAGYHISLSCKAVKVDTNPVIQRFEIKWMQMDSLSCSSRLKELFPKQSFETILLFFKDYIYWFIWTALNTFLWIQSAGNEILSACPLMMCSQIRLYRSWYVLQTDWGCDWTWEML